MRTFMDGQTKIGTRTANTKVARGSSAIPWAIFPIVGWGFGLAGHAMEAFDYNPFLGKSWEDKKIRELMEKDDFDKK